MRLLGVPPYPVCGRLNEICHFLWATYMHTSTYKTQEHAEILFFVLTFSLMPWYYKTSTPPCNQHLRIFIHCPTVGSVAPKGPVKRCRMPLRNVYAGKNVHGQSMCESLPAASTCFRTSPLYTFISISTCDQPPSPYIDRRLGMALLLTVPERLNLICLLGQKRTTTSSWKGNTRIFLIAAPHRLQRYTCWCR